MHVSNTVSNLAVAVISGIHFVISAAEIFFPKRLLQLDDFRFTPSEAGKAGPIVANAGIYNAFVASGLLWSLNAGGDSLRYFFLACVMIAGVFGAVTLKAPKTLGLQPGPAVIAACLVWMAA